jgi:hypothetical protein
VVSVSRPVMPRTASDPVVERCPMDPPKLSPYTMFYRKLYQLVLARLRLLCLRLRPSSHNEFERIVWNSFLFLFYNHTNDLLRSRHLDQILLSCIFYSANSLLFGKEENEIEITWPRLMQAYRSMPGSKPKILRSVFLRRLALNEDLPSEQQNGLLKNNEIFVRIKFFLFY